MFVNSVFHKLNNSISSDFSTLFYSFNLALSHSLDIFSPSINLINRTYSKSPWFNTELIKLRQLLRRLQRKYALSRLDSDLIAFKACRSFYKNKLLSTKSSYFTDMYGSYGIFSKQAYKLSFTLVGKTQTRHLPDKPGSVLCSLFANFFQQKNASIINVLPNINSVRLNPNLTYNLNYWSCYTLPTYDFVLSLMTSLKTNSPLDPIPLNLRRLLSPYFIGLITEIIYRSLISSIVPHSMKYSYIIPIFKKTTLDQSNLSSYRPISQLSSISKTLERVVSTQLINYITSNYIVDKYQSALLYLPHRSTETALILIINDILTSLDNKAPCYLVLLI